MAALCASLILFAIVVAHGVRSAAEAGATPAAIVWWMGTAFTALVILTWWIITELMPHRRRRTSAPRDCLPAGADDARSVVGIANGGFVFHAGINAAVVAQQAFWALVTFGYPTGETIPRATCIALGAVTVYLGNLWPRMPTPRAPEREAARRMKLNRRSGWAMVTVGLLGIALGLFLPLFLPPGYRP